MGVTVNFDRQYFLLYVKILQGVATLRWIQQIYVPLEFLVVSLRFLKFRNLLFRSSLRLSSQLLSVLLRSKRSNKFQANNKVKMGGYFIKFTKTTDY